MIVVDRCFYRVGIDSGWSIWLRILKRVGELIKISQTF